MAAVTITRDEFEDFLDEIVGEVRAYWNEVDEAGVGEYIYYIASPLLPENVVVRVCSTINTYNDESRGTGADSIKVMLWHVSSSNPVGGREFTQRIETWQKNLRPKILQCLTEWEDMIYFCDDCDIPMVVRSGPHGTFRGCLNYPDCENKVST